MGRVRKTLVPLRRDIGIYVVAGDIEIRKKPCGQALFAIGPILIDL